MITQPLTRNIEETIDALEISRAEIGFQIDRLRNQVLAVSEQETSHLLDVLAGYMVSYRSLAMLINYHRGRVAVRQGALPQGDGDERRAVVNDEVER